MKSLSLTFNKEIGFAIMQMFSTLDKVRSDTSIEITPDQKGFKITKKSEEDIVNFDFDEKPLFKKIMDSIGAGQSTLSLTGPETDLFEKCLHAAYYYIQEIKSEAELKKNNYFLEFYKELMLQRDGKG